MNPSTTRTVGIRSAGAWAASATPRAMRSISSRMSFLASGAYERTVSWRRTSSGMMLAAVPPWIEPTVTTAGSTGSMRRLTIVCTAVTNWAAITIGSLVTCGRAPCPPTPRITTSTVSTLANAYPSTTPTAPTGSAGVTCSATHTAGLGKRANSPSLSNASAPRPRSSAGWPIITSVPRQRSLMPASTRAVPTKIDMWASWPQACITPTSRPSSSFARAALAYGRPVASVTGSASMSVRTRSVGPAPLRRTPTTPHPPTRSVTSNPALRSSAAIRADVRCSWSESSGAPCRVR